MKIETITYYVMCGVICVVNVFITILISLYTKKFVLHDNSEKQVTQVVCFESFEEEPTLEVARLDELGAF